MKIFLRIEVLFLLVLAAAGGVWVLFSDKPNMPDVDKPKVVATSDDPGKGTSDDPGKGTTLVRRCRLERDFGNARLDVDLRVTNPHTKQLLLAPPALRLINAKGEDVPAYFLPTEPPPELPAKSTSEVKMRFWLEALDVKGPLVLEVDGQRFDIKSATPLDLETMKNAEPQEMPVGGDWTGAK
jgi:hypothetical protein